MYFIVFLIKIHHVELFKNCSWVEAKQKKNISLVKEPATIFITQQISLEMDFTKYLFALVDLGRQ